LTSIFKAFNLLVSANENKINGQIFNIGLDNYQIKNLAYLVRDHFPLKVEIDIAPDDNDKRNYNVDFSKAKEILSV
jgi:hypothetical protein